MSKFSSFILNPSFLLEKRLILSHLELGGKIYYPQRKMTPSAYSLEPVFIIFPVAKRARKSAKRGTGHLLGEKGEGPAPLTPP
jgi:hypothetical protein